MSEFPYFPIAKTTQKIFRKYSEDIQKIFRRYSEDILTSKLFRNYSEDIQKLFSWRFFLRSGGLNGKGQRISPFLLIVIDIANKALHLPEPFIFLLNNEHQIEYPYVATPS